MTGVGKTEDDAVEKFVDGVIDIVEWHIEKDSLTEFLNERFTERKTRKEFDIAPSVPSYMY